MSYRLVRLVAASALTVAGVSFGDVALAIDCRVRDADFRDPSWSCIPASQFNTCISPADLGDSTCLELDTDAQLCGGSSSFRMRVYVTRDNVELDCNDQILDLSGLGGSGVRLPQTRSLRGVEIRSCEIRSPGRYGVNLKRFFRADEPGLTSSHRYELHGELEGHRDIHISGLSIYDANASGVYVGQASSNVVIEGTVIQRASLGVYIEASSTDIVVSRSVITDSRDREGIAIDSSQRVLVENSYFANNGKGEHEGAINLYHNCGERHDDAQVCPVRRPLTASFNTIRGNEFADGDIRVASRQFRLETNKCIGISFRGYWRDHAANNFVYRNVFHGGVKLDVQDGPISVNGNTFYESSELEIGKGQPLGVIDQEIEIDGEISENSMEFGSRWDWDGGDVSGLELLNNQYFDDRCIRERDNQCTSETRIPLGREILPASVVPALF